MWNGKQYAQNLSFKYKDGIVGGTDEQNKHNENQIKIVRNRGNKDADADKIRQCILQESCT